MKITIIGAGNMGGAVAAGLAKGNLVQSADIVCTARTQTTLDKIRAIDPEITITTDNSAAAKEADIIILAVKPWLMEEVIADMRASFDPLNQIFVSVAAGGTLEELCSWICPSSPSSVTVFRAIPNTAASVLAKTYRDEYMRKLAKDYPQYGWERNMGYPTKEHVEAIIRHGYTPHHRKSFHLKQLEPTLF